MNIKVSTITLWSIFLLLLFLAGFRWDVGIDWANYMGIGENAAVSARIEPACLALKFVLYSKGFTDGGYWLWIMAFIILYFFFYSFWKFSISPVFSAALFVCLGIFFETLNGVRQYAAISLFIYSWQFIFRKQVVRYLIVILIGSLFHTSMLFMLPVYWIASIKYNKKFLAILCILCIPLSLLSSAIIPKIIGLFPQYTVYEDMEFAIAANSNKLAYLRMLFPLFIFLISYPFYDKLSQNRYSRVICNLSITYIIITTLFPSIQLAIRIGYYFQPAFLFFIPILCSCQTIKNAILFKIITIVYSIGFVYTTMLSRPVSKIWPFKLDFRLADQDLLFILGIMWTFIYIFIFITRIHTNPKPTK